MNVRKRKVIESAQQLFIEKGFSSTSVQDILDLARISKGTFYNYFTSKNECLIAILENGREETRMRRKELLIGQDAANKDVFAKQISVRQKVNLDYNLMPIFEAVLHSEDAELRVFAKKHYISELSWLSDRLVDVYGQNASPYASDCAVIMLGIMQHVIYVRTANLVQDIDTNELAEYAIRRVDSILQDMIDSSDRIFVGDPFSFADKNNISTTINQVLDTLNKFQNLVRHDVDPNLKQYTDFIIEEIDEENPRVFLLETVTRSFRKAYVDTPFEFEAQELASTIWGYLDTLK